MPHTGDRGAVSAIYRLSRRSRSVRTTKLKIMQGGRAGPEGAGRTTDAHAAPRRRTRVGNMWPDDVRRMARSGLVSCARGDGLPAVTPVGRWSATAYGLGITFFEMCVLAKVYCTARSMAGAREGAGGPDPARAETIPLRTVQYFFEDWPVYPGRVHHALSRLRGRGLIPRSRPKRVACDMARLDAMREDLLGVGRWVDDTGEEIRRVLSHGY